MKTELPPTDGLPLRARDLWPGPRSLAAQLAQTLSIPSPQLTCSGTAALVVALRVLSRLQPTRKRVIVSAWSCPLVPLAASACPDIEFVLCDLKPESLDLDPAMLESLCVGHPPLAIIITHLAGRVSATRPALDIARRYEAYTIEDAAQALGAQVDGQSVGLQGDIGFFSLAFGKGLTCAEGGVLFSRHPELHQQLAAQAQSDLPWRPGIELQRCIELLGYSALYHPRGLTWIYGKALRKALRDGDWVTAVGDDFSAADIPLHRLGNWRSRVAARAALRLPDYWQSGRLRAARRCAQLKQLPGVAVMEDSPGVTGVWPILLVLMPDEAQRDAVLQALAMTGLGVTRLFIHPLSDYPDVVPWLVPGSTIDNARTLAARTLSITNSPWLTEALFERILTCLAAHLATPMPDQLPPVIAD